MNNSYINTLLNSYRYQNIYDLNDFYCLTVEELVDGLQKICTNSKQQKFTSSLVDTYKKLKMYPDYRIVYLPEELEDADWYYKNTNDSYESLFLNLFIGPLAVVQKSNNNLKGE